MSNLWKTLETLKNHQWIELSHELSNESPYWQGMPKGVLELNKTVIDFSEMNLRIQTFKFPGQFGTHIDYPGHFIQNARLAKDFNISDTILPLVVIDLNEKVKENNDYEISIEDILDFEEALENADENGNAHTPGWPIPTLEFLFDNRNVAGVGHETFDTDAAVTCAKNGDLAGERYILGRDKFQVEVLNNLDKLPPIGAIIFIAAPRISDANGLPVRVWAII